VADSAPVFEKILESCGHLFSSSEQGILLSGDDGRIHLGAHRGVARERLEPLFPSPRPVGVDEAMFERRVLHYADVLADPDVPAGIRAVAERLAIGPYSQVFVPLLWEERAIGSLYVIRQPPTGFADKEIDLLRTFADQAVIAIHNARLFRETREALDRQTATSEVLSVISESPTDVQPVFEAVAERSGLLCHAEGSRIFLPEGDALVAVTGYRSATGVDGGRGDRLQMTPTSVVARAFLRAEVVQIEDASALDAARYPDTAKMHERHGYRTVLAVPLVREGAAVGVIGLSRREVRPFSEAEIALVRTFADQAVIAIENVRLFNETREALERQTAIAGILSVISSSPTDTAPVFEAIVQSCQRLFGGLFVAFARPHDGLLHMVAHADDGTAHGRAGAHLPPWPLDRSSAAGTCILEARVVNVADTEAAVPQFPRMRDLAIRLGYRSGLFVPLLRDERAVGAIVILRGNAGAFNEREVNLARAFADQAVIAIENVRLFNEIQDKSRQLELANKHKSEFLANMSHELRTPLNAIIGFSEVLAEQMFGDVNEKQLEYLKDIHTSGHHLLSLINDILDLSKIEAGRMELDLASVNLPMLLDNCTTLVRERASRQGLTLALDVADDVGDWVADVRKVKQIVINLLSNAVKFTPAGGRVTLRARRVGDEVEIAVIDTGVGIAPDQQALVFEEFRQAGGDYLRKAEGTGLGLSLARRFVELHGGRIRVDSAPGRGSTFAFVLPQRAPVEPAALHA
jgi:signal transduction histidine kinase